jgi:uncharacterized membrane protein
VDESTLGGLIAGGALLLGGIAVWWVARLGSAGRLPRNYWAGIRTPATLASDRAWAEAHRAGGSALGVGGAAGSAGGAAAVATGVAGAAAWVVFAVIGAGAAVMLAFVVLGGVRGVRAARAVR